MVRSGTGAHGQMETQSLAQTPGRFLQQIKGFQTPAWANTKFLQPKGPTHQVDFSPSGRGQLDQPDKGAGGVGAARKIKTGVENLVGACPFASSSRKGGAKPTAADEFGDIRPDQFHPGKVTRGCT